MTKEATRDEDYEQLLPLVGVGVRMWPDLQSFLLGNYARWTLWTFRAPEPPCRPADLQTSDYQRVCEYRHAHSKVLPVPSFSPSAQNHSTPISNNHPLAYAGP